MEVPTPLKSDRPNALSTGSGTWISSLTVGLLVALAGSGAAASQDGVLIGVPSIWVLAMAVAAAVWTRVSPVRGLAGFLLPALAVLIAAFSLPGSSFLLLFSGPPLFAFAAAALVLAVAAKGKCPPRAFFLPFFFSLYAFISYEAQNRVGPDGDEPQYLMIAESLLRDHDLSLDADFQEQRYTAFFARPLAPDFRVRGPEGQIYSLHAVGLAILILPAYAFGGYAGASFFMAFLAVLLLRELRRLVEALCGDTRLAEGTAWLIGLSPPLIHYAGLVFTEVPAALLLAVGLRAAVFGRRPRTRWIAALCAAALPWLNVRYSILAIGVALALLARGWSESGAAAAVRKLAGPALVPVASALALGFYHYALWGFFDPRRVYGRRREFDLEILPEGLPGLFFDQEFGLLVYAPIFVLCLGGFVLLWRRQRALALAGLFAVAGVVATASVWPMWRGGFNPPGRFLVPLISILAATLALSLQRGIRPATALLAGWGLWCGLSGAMNIETVHRDRDGVAPFFRTQSGAREWTAPLPSFVLSEDRPTRALAVPWAILLGLPLIFALRKAAAEPRPIRHRDTLLVSAMFMATAAIADRASPRIRAPERDASRLVGLPSVRLPSMRVEAATEAAWTANVFHEPHRYPQGLVFARALSLAQGRYSLVLSATERIQEPPSLLIRNRRTGRTDRSTMSAVPEGVQAGFEIPASGEFDLSLVGGEPFLAVTARLSAPR